MDRIPTDPASWPEGSSRVMVFRAFKDTRTAAGLLVIFYEQEVIRNDIDQLKERIRSVYGPGDYRVAVQDMIAGTWTYGMSFGMRLSAPKSSSEAQPEDGVSETT